MSKQAQVVLWIGLLLIVVQLAAEWSFLKKLLFTNPSTSSGSSSGGNSAGGSLFPGHWGPFGPGGVWPFSTIGYQTTPKSKRVTIT
jgi:hypothetical protein